MTEIRAMIDDDVTAAVRLHLEVLDMEFLSRFGPSFMASYYRAWMATAGGVSLVAVSDAGDVVGLLLGATAPSAHARAMVREHGVALASRMVTYALWHPALAKDLIVTRARRYLGGVARVIRSRWAPATPTAASSGGPAVAEITHVLVEPSVQGGGVGRALVERAVSISRDAGADEVELVTPPDLAAQHFYEHLGWQCEGSLRSRSGEEFLRYRLALN